MGGGGSNLSVGLTLSVLKKKQRGKSWNWSSSQSLRFIHLRFYDWSKIGACSIELGGIYVCLVVICHLKKQIVLPECLNSGFKSRVFMTSVNLFSCFIAFAWHFYHDCFEFSFGLWVKIKIAWRERANAENIR